MALQNIRNFSIIAHIDHGKSTLADRMLELTGTIERRQMKAQVLDAMPLERERGITIKMTPVRMVYGDHILNLIDTPGHIDFSYEVSRALKAVEGVILLVDASQGVQAQTLSVLDMARELNLQVIPVINKIDLPHARVVETRQEIIDLLRCAPADILAVSAKTGDGVAALLEAIISRVPPPTAAMEASPGCRALVFDFEYSAHQGIIVYARVFDGLIKPGDRVSFSAAGEHFTVVAVGYFLPGKTPASRLEPGEIGYIVTGIKKTGRAKVGDTIIDPRRPLQAFPGYTEPQPVVWASIYPTSQDDLPVLKQALGRLQLSDASLSFEEEASSALGRGFRCGFLGLLHLEIVTERLRREFNLDLIIATPTIGYEVEDRRTGMKEAIYSPQLFPEETKLYLIREPWASARIILPPVHLPAVMKIFNDHEVIIRHTANFGAERVVVDIELPLRELMRNFFDELKSVSSGFASLTYRLVDYRTADVDRLDVLVAEKPVAAFTRVVAHGRLQVEAEAVVEKLKKVLPRQLIMIKIQARGLGRILAARSLPALRKDVTDYLYGGDITRKMKLREKQKRGKKKMQAVGSVAIPHDVFLKMISSEKK